MVTLENSAVKRYFEILAELNPTKKYDYELKINNRCCIIDCCEWYDVTHLLNGESWWDGEIQRDCPALVRLVEETNGQCVRYGPAVIAELPDDVEWEILSWDGGGESFEEVHEKHRKWVFEPKQNQVVYYDGVKRHTEQTDESIRLIDKAISLLMHANNLLKLNTPSRNIMQSLAELAEALKEDTLTKES